MSGSRRVLMLCYYFPPLRAPGSTRSAAFARLLPACGWQPVVLTVKAAKDSWVGTGEPLPGGVETVRTSEWNLHGTVNFLQGVTSRALSLVGLQAHRNYWREIFCVPDDQMAWLSTARGTSLARECDAVYASCSPFSSALSAIVIGRLTGRPVVLDFRDPWYLNPHSDHGVWRAASYRILERLALHLCDRLIVNTPGAEALYVEHYPELTEKIVTIPNGYDALPSLEQKQEVPGPFTIMHVGTFYGSRGPRTLMDAIEPLTDVRIVQVGTPLGPLTNNALAGRVTVTGNVSREAALALMRDASLLYLKQGTESRARKYVAVAAKTYEYLATGLPILADCPEGDNAEMVRRYAAYPYLVTAPDPESLRKEILRAMQNRDDLHPRRTEAFEREFDRAVLTQKLAAVLDATVRGR